LAWGPNTDRRCTPDFIDPMASISADDSRAALVRDEKPPGNSRRRPLR
jgi:hypothetical protein